MPLSVALMLISTVFALPCTSVNLRTQVVAGVCGREGPPDSKQFDRPSYIAVDKQRRQLYVLENSGSVRVVDLDTGDVTEIPLNLIKAETNVHARPSAAVVLRSGHVLLAVKGYVVI